MFPWLALSEAEFLEVSVPILTFVPKNAYLLYTPAGGYDAIWLLVFDPADCPEEYLPSRRVEALWSGWKGLDVSPLSASESVAKGVRVENLGDIPGLREVVER